MAEYNYFERLSESLEQAVAFSKGDKSKARVSVYEIPVPIQKNTELINQLISRQ